MSGLIISDGLARLSHKDDEEDNSAPITLTVYVGLDWQGNETEDRRFVISGGSYGKLFAVFNRDEFSFIRKGSNGRVILVVHPPGNFWGKFFYSMKMSFSRDGALEEFIEEMGHHTSSNAATREASTLLAPYL